MSSWLKITGTQVGKFVLGLTGVTLKNSSGNLLVRNNADSADAEVTASKVNISGNVLDLNSDAAGSGADWLYTLQRPASGMTAAVTLTLPDSDGSPSQVLSTDGSGVLSWISAGSTTQCVTADTTSFAFGSGSTITAFTLPANAVVDRVVVIVDTAFDSTPTLSVGVNGGSASKYVASTDLALTVADRYEVPIQSVANGSTEAIELYYSAAAASVGAGRVLVYYSVPA